ncbi:MAG: membrane protein insertase YidC, partial [Deltaproteobacteria bacterium]|nr:membrane protein insertase YidC [Deltaproteobacteria bacterium]
MVKGVYRADIHALPPKKKKGYYSFVGLAILVNDELEELDIEEPSESDAYKGRVEWMAYEDEYFISAIIPEATEGSFRGRLAPSGMLSGRYVSPPVSLGALAQISSRYTLYFGPRDLAVLKGLEKNLDRAVNFGWTDIIARPLLYLLRFFNQYIHNYGVSIILLTILIKILFWPLTHKSYKSMKEMQKLQPRMAKLREKYKDNKQQLNKEMMALYKTYKVNPMGGCLPMVIQIPVFFALFRLLGSAIELRHAPFTLWIKDLSAPDRLFNFPFTIPLMEPPYGIPVLTLLMGASMFIQQKMTPTPGDPTQAKIMMFLPVIFTFLFINFPSGLVLYWLVNNILSIGQQYRIHRRPA